MSKLLTRSLDKLKRDLLELGAMVERETEKAILALVDRRTDLADEVKRGGGDIDRREVDIERECLTTLALHQPVATDLRFIIVALKVNNDLERMGDLAINIAARAADLAKHAPIATPLHFPEMAACVRSMVRKSLDALVNLDTAMAREVLAMDDQVDASNRRMYTLLQELMQQDPQTIERAVHLLSASRHLERMADLATNIAEEVVFMVEGHVIRHRVGGHPDDSGGAA